MKPNIIFLIGAARSGTTLLGEQILSQHLDVHYLGEPDFIWQPAVGYNSDDVLLENYSRGKQKIRDRFTKIGQKHNKVILEKTPSNCFRIPYINSVFPEAKFIQIVRDGREVALSASKEWGAKKSKALDSKDIRSTSIITRLRKTTIREAEFSERFSTFSDFYYLPKYGVKFINYLRRQLFKNDRLPWGPVFPGLKQVRRRFSLLTTCAIQWERSVVAADSAFNQIEKERVLKIKYEDLIERPEDNIKLICGFMGISSDSQIINGLSKKIVSHNTQKWKTEIGEDELKEMMNEVSFTLKELGYN